VSDVIKHRDLRVRGILIFGFVALLWGWIAYPWLSGEVTIPYDAKAHFQAQIQFLANALHRGDSPFWTPNIFGGSPQIADPQSLIFSPAILLAVFDKAPSFRSMDTYVLGLLLLGGLAFAQFGRERGWHPAAQVVAALVFAFGASASWRLQHVGQVQSLACFAVAFWLLARALASGSWRSGLCAGVAAGLMVVKPDQVAYLGALVLAAYAIWFVGKDRSPFAALRRAWPALVAGGVVGLAIVAVPLLMTVLFSEASNRAEIEYAEAARGSLHPAFLLTAFIGDLFGAADPKVDFWGPSSASWSPGSLTLSQNMGQVYVGALPLLAVIIWLAGGWRQIVPEARFILGALGAIMIYALGAYTPLFPAIFAWLPGADLFRRPADATFMMGALMALLSGFALDGLIRGGGTQGLPKALAFAGASIAAASGLSLALAWSVGALASASSAIFTGCCWLVLALALLALVMRYSQAAPQSRPVATLLLAVLCLSVAVDIKLNNGPNESTATSPQVYDVMEPATDNHTITYLQAVLARSNREPGRRDRIDLLGGGFHWPNLGMIHGFDTVFGYNPLHMADFTDATGARDHMGGPLDRHRLFTRLFPSYRSTFADMLGIRFVVSDTPMDRVDCALTPGDLVLLARTRDSYIYENPRALPRAMFVSSVKLANFASLLDDGLPADFDPRNTVLLERLPDEAVLTSPNASRPGEAKVRLVSYANTEVVVEVVSANAGYLVLNDVWHPWWTATVNDEDADILKANVVFRAVQVEAGTSLVRFSFHPLDGAIAELREKVMGPDEEPATIVSMVP
jgi:hypothetical protein